MSFDPAEQAGGPEPRPGSVVGGFQLLRLLGEGGMGKVYLARDPAAGREVALKLLTGTAAANRERFEREGELASRLRHPGIVQVHSAGEHGPFRYLVCELVPGARPLDEAWAHVHLRRRVSWVLDAAWALGYAHEHGVVHRDVKPANLLVDAGGTLRVADFGVAAAADLERLTRTGALIGTPTHMSPEQLVGARATPVVDVWGLGVVLYQALTDELPFSGTSWMQLIDAIQRGAKPPSSSTGAELPADLERICMGALSPDPELRPQSGSALAEQLEDWLRGRGVRARRRPRRLGQVLVGLTLLSGAGGLAWRLASRPGAELALNASPTPRALTGSELLLRARAAEAEQDLEGALALYRDAAEAGEVEAQLWLGRRLYQGEGVARDASQALAWWRRAAEAGSAQAAMNLSLAHSRGEHGVARDEAAALRWLRRAAEGGEPAACARLGLRLLQGKDTERAEGVALVRRAAEAGEVLAMLTLASLLREGKLVEADPVESVRWYRRAAEGGNALAMRCVGAAYLSGRGAERDEARALIWIGRGAEAGDTESMVQLALLLEGKGDERDRATADRWLRRAVEAGSANACVLLSNRYPKDSAEAAALIRQAAEAGSEQAMLFYAKRLAAGEGVARDAAEAERWFARSLPYYRAQAERGERGAMYELALAYLEGRGAERDPAQGMRWLETSAKAGHVPALSHLGRLLLRRPGGAGRAVPLLREAAEQGDARAMAGYGLALWKGAGVPRDRAAARRWYRAAADKGSRVGKYELARVLASERPAEAEQLLRQLATEQFPAGMRALGLLLLQARGPEHAPEGLEWLRRAEERGDVGAANALGVAFVKGKAGVKQDYAEAARHFNLAARGGHAEAAYALGRLFQTGRGVPQSAQKAAACFQRAAELARRAGEAKVEAAARERLAELGS